MSIKRRAEARKHRAPVQRCPNNSSRAKAHTACALRGCSSPPPPPPPPPRLRNDRRDVGSVARVSQQPVPRVARITMFVRNGSFQYSSSSSRTLCSGAGNAPTLYAIKRWTRYPPRAAVVRAIKTISMAAQQGLACVSHVDRCLPSSFPPSLLDIQDA